MNYSEQQIKAVVMEAVSKLINEGKIAGSSSPAFTSSGESWLCDTAEEAVSKAKTAFEQLNNLSLEKRKDYIAAMRKAAIENAETLAEAAHNETGYGVIEHKVLKNILAAEKTPGVEDVEPRVFTGDYGMTLVEQAPFGVICSITPSTNPTSTVINNCISMISAGNSVVFNPHPAAKTCSQQVMRILNNAIISAGGPANLITTVKEPTLESGKIMMEHKDVPLLSVTGGEAVVHVAMRTGKKVIAAGPGNPPVIVDETAEIPHAAKSIVDGAAFDNNVLCLAEKEAFVVSQVADKLMNEMTKVGAHKVQGHEIDKIVQTVLIKKDNNYVINRKYVGRNATQILNDCGIPYSGNPRLIIAEVDRFHPFVMVEMLMPVLGIVRVNSITEAITEAVRAEQSCHHSAIMHSTNIKNLSDAARALNTTIFVKNAPSYSGVGFEAEGYTTLTIATPTGEGLTSARSFTRARRCVLKDYFRII